MTCPNCTDECVEMTHDGYGVYSRRNLTHTCPECGYTERRP